MTTLSIRTLRLALLAAKQDNGTNWEHMRSTRSHQRQHEPNETPRHSATHTHLRGSNGGPPTAQSRPILHPQGPLVQASYSAQSPEGSFFRAEGSFFPVLIGKLIPKAHFYLFILPKAHFFGPKAHFSVLILPEAHFLRADDSFLCFLLLVPSRRLITENINGK